MPPRSFKKKITECNAHVQLRTSLKEGDVEDVFESLRNPFLNLEDVVYNKNKEEYYQALRSKVHEFDYSILKLSEKLRQIIIEINFSKLFRLLFEKLKLFLVNKLRYYALNKDSEGFNNFILKMHIEGYNHRFRNTYIEEIKNKGIKNKDELRRLIEKVNKNMRAVIDDKLKGTLVPHNSAT